jgi:hypothetical protein
MIPVLCPVRISWEEIYDPGPLYSRISWEDICVPGAMSSRDKLGEHL